jgi:hypothetical protein
MLNDSVLTQVSAPECNYVVSESVQASLTAAAAVAATLHKGPCFDVHLHRVEEKLCIALDEMREGCSALKVS